MNRRSFLKGTIAGAATLTLGQRLMVRALAAQPSVGPTFIEIDRRTIEVNGRAASVFGLRQPNGTAGIRLGAGDPFDVLLRNKTVEPTIIHWHGLTPPWPSDGVADAPLPLIAAGAERSFDFPVKLPGTYWMHAHTLQEQQLLAAPLIVADPADSGRDEQEVVVLLHDFSFTPATALLEKLTAAKPGSGTINSGREMSGMMDMGSGNGMGGMDMKSMPGMDMSAGGGMAGMGAMAMDLNDIEYDAYLANDRALDDPEVIPVERGGRVRVRIINGATATAFTLDFGELEGTLIAVDGHDIEPVAGRRFPVSMGQRIDVRLELPKKTRAFPILALRQGAKERTGFILRPTGAGLAKIASLGTEDGPVLDLELEAQLRGKAPLTARPVAKTFIMNLLGDMAAYRWSLETDPALVVDKGDRVEVTLRNQSMMAHPMHLHGHHFQVVAIDGKRVPGAVRDTLHVPPARSVTIAVDANNPGQWALHCHHLYHMVAGMMSTFAYNA
jgi:FtsP/CotA-like multicopper oxidase with cupredoxin domain